MGKEIQILVFHHSLLASLNNLQSTLLHKSLISAFDATQAFANAGFHNLRGCSSAATIFLS